METLVANHYDFKYAVDIDSVGLDYWRWLNSYKNTPGLISEIRGFHRARRPFNIVCPYEAYVGIDNQYNSLLEAVNGDADYIKNYVTVIAGSEPRKNAERYKRVVYGSFIFDWMQHDPYSVPAYNDKIPEHDFLSFNRIIRPHRLMLIAALAHIGLLDKNLVSYTLAQLEHFPKFALDGVACVPDERAKKITEILAELPTEQKADPITWDSNLSVMTAPSDLYENAFYSLVTETAFFEDDPFLTEKIIKPLTYGHPFITLAPKNTLSLLQAYGFKTYSSIFDESYDTVDEGYVRFRRVIKEVVRIANLTQEDKAHLFASAREIGEHNSAHFKKNVKQIIEMSSNINEHLDIKNKVLR